MSICLYFCIRWWGGVADCGSSKFWRLAIWLFIVSTVAIWAVMPLQNCCIKWWSNYWIPPFLSFWMLFSLLTVIWLCKGCFRGHNFFYSCDCVRDVVVATIFFLFLIVLQYVQRMPHLMHSKWHRCPFSTYPFRLLCKVLFIIR